MSQWGSLGYAVNYGWTTDQILNHFYGGTTAGSYPGTSISVELLGWRARELVATAPGLAINGVAVPGGYVAVLRTGPGTFAYRTATSCGGPWSGYAAVPGATSYAQLTGNASEIEVCEAGQTRGYVGDLVAYDQRGEQAVVNRTGSEIYLRGVVPRESPASWADVGGGRGAAALRAQAIAARSYLLSATYGPNATTCDTTACQVYGGAYIRPFGTSVRTSLYDARSDAAVAATDGQVRRLGNGSVARTEFSSSSGGWTAGGQFPAVPDLGDGIASNPNRNWTATFTFSELSARLGVGEVRGIAVSGRNGLGADGGRATTVAVSTSSGTVTLTGNVVRQRLGLKSDWFFTTASYYTAAQAESLTRALYNDLLQRTPSSDEITFWTRVLTTGSTATSVAYGFAGSTERAYQQVYATYQGALHRNPSAGDLAFWGEVYLRGGQLSAVRTGIFGSAEALAANGGTPETWVGQVYRVLLQRDPSVGETAYWAAAARTRGRASVAWSIANSLEALSQVRNRCYLDLLQRPAESGLNWINELAGPGSNIVVEASIAGSAEYLQRAQARFPSP